MKQQQQQKQHAYQITIQTYNEGSVLSKPNHSLISQMRKKNIIKKTHTQNWINESKTKTDEMGGDSSYTHTPSHSRSLNPIYFVNTLFSLCAAHMSCTYKIWANFWVKISLKSNLFEMCARACGCVCVCVVCHHCIMETRWKSCIPVYSNVCVFFFSLCSMFLMQYLSICNNISVHSTTNRSVSAFNVFAFFFSSLPCSVSLLI